MVMLYKDKVAAVDHGAKSVQNRLHRLGEKSYRLARATTSVDLSRAAFGAEVKLLSIIDEHFRISCVKTTSEVEVPNVGSKTIRLRQENQYRDMRMTLRTPGGRDLIELDFPVMSENAFRLLFMDLTRDQTTSGVQMASQLKLSAHQLGLMASGKVLSLGISRSTPNLERVRRMQAGRSDKAKSIRPDIGKITDAVRQHGPQVLRSLHTRLTISEAEEVCRRINAQRGTRMQPFDLPGTYGIWSACNAHGVPYWRIAANALILRIADELDVDSYSVKGFAKVLKRLSHSELSGLKINAFGTTLGGMLAGPYSDSPSTAIIDLVYNDARYAAIKKVGLMPYDFPRAPHSSWVGPTGEPTDLARFACRELIFKLAAEKGVDPTTTEGFKAILPSLTQEPFLHKEINAWGTTLGGMLERGYYGSPSEAVLDLISYDPDFCKIAEAGLRTWDFPTMPACFWQDSAGNATANARMATKELLRTIAEEVGADFHTVLGFKKILPLLHGKTFLKTVCNVWGTRLGKMLIGSAYAGSPSAAILDLIQHDREFFEIKTVGLGPRDFPRVPRNFWLSKTKEATPQARQATLDLLKIILGRDRLNLYSMECLKLARARLSNSIFLSTPINVWGTKLAGMFTTAYGSRIKRTLVDLVLHENRFAHIRKEAVAFLSSFQPPKNGSGKF